jgi:hypothetical protein
VGDQRPCGGCGPDQHGQVDPHGLPGVVSWISEAPAAESLELAAIAPDRRARQAA